MTVRIGNNGQKYHHLRDACAVLEKVHNRQLHDRWRTKRGLTQGSAAGEVQ